MSIAGRLFSFMQSGEHLVFDVTVVLQLESNSICLYCLYGIDLLHRFSSLIVDNRMCGSCCSGHVRMKWMLQERLQRSFVNQWRR